MPLVGCLLTSDTWTEPCCEAADIKKSWSEHEHLCSKVCSEAAFSCICSHARHARGQPTPLHADVCTQVTDALNIGALSPPDIPYDLMRTLLHLPAIMAELRSFVASGSGLRPDRSVRARCSVQLQCTGQGSRAVGHTK